MSETSQLEIAYRLVCACCYEPDQQWQEAQLFDHLTSAITTIHPTLADCAQALKHAFQQDDRQALLVDYAALFVGPGTLLAAPYGSVYLEPGRQVMGDSTQAALELYCAAGLQLSDDFPELPDHIAVELEFCSYLLQRQQAAEQAGDTGESEQWQEQRAHFLRQHLGRWVAPFCDAVREHAETGFYRKLTDLIEELVATDLNRLSSEA